MWGVAGPILVDNLSPPRPGWVVEFDPIMGPYWAKRVENYRGRCFDCGIEINGSAKLKERGGVQWVVCCSCPPQVVKKSRKKP